MSCSQTVVLLPMFLRFPKAFVVWERLRLGTRQRVFSNFNFSLLSLLRKKEKKKREREGETISEGYTGQVGDQQGIRTTYLFFKKTKTTNGIHVYTPCNISREINLLLGRVLSRAQPYISSF